GALREIGFRYENDVYPFEQFDLRNNRPDILVQHLLDTLPVSPAAHKEMERMRDECLRLYRKRLTKLGFTEDQLSSKVDRPEVTLSEGIVNNGECTFTVHALDKKSLLDRLLVFVNDVPAVAQIDGQEAAGSKGLDLKDRK